MLSHGSNLFGIIFFLIVTSSTRLAGCQEHNYYICSYEQNNRGIFIILSCLDLDSKSITRQCETQMQGELVSKKPLLLEQNHHKYFLVATNNGTVAKNSNILPIPITSYSIYNEEFIEVNQGQISETQIADYVDSDSLTAANIRFLEYRGDSSISYIAVPNLNNRGNIEMLGKKQYLYPDSIYHSIGGFSHFYKLNNYNEKYYWGLRNRELYLLILDLQRSNLINMLKIANNRSYANLYYLSLADSIIYTFFLNYNSMGPGGEEPRKAVLDPSFLRTYNMQTLTPLDSIPIHNPNINEGYIQPETGICDKIGPYLVYYFFLQETYYYYSPAMLFIFDTRTNEATWLRVGWR